MSEIDAVTGAFSYTGKYLTQRLLAMGRQVRTLTGHPHNPHPFGDQVSVFPLDFDNFAGLVKSLEGVNTFYVSYWIRFAYRQMTYAQAVENTKVLFRAAKEAGTQRVVYISISHPSVSSPLPYFSGKAELEGALKDSGLSYAILRPTVIFGDEGILLNNIAWLLRKFPLFAIPGSGAYQLQPVFVEDLADLMVKIGQQHEDVLLDAVGPETYSFEELVRLVAQKVHRPARILHVSPGLMFLLSRLISPLVGDVVLTREEIRGLMDNLLISAAPPTAPTRLSEWLEQHASKIGTSYFSELRRHYL